MPLATTLIIIAVIVFIAGLVRYIRSLAASAAVEAARLAGSEEVVLLEEGANNFGFASRGFRQWRGNGHLLMTARRLVFVMWAPRWSLVIPREHIRRVERRKSHNGRIRRNFGSKWPNLIWVEYTTDRGTVDSIAWMVKDSEAWLGALPGLINQ